MAGHGKVQDKVEATQTPRSFVAYRSVQDGLEQISAGNDLLQVFVKPFRPESSVVHANRKTYFVPYIIALGNMSDSAAPIQLPTSRQNGRIRRFGISTTRKRLAPSIRLRNQPKGIRSEVK